MPRAAVPALTSAEAFRLPRLRGGLPLGLVLPALALVAWQIAASRQLVAPELLPRPAQVAQAVLALARSGELWLHVRATLVRIGIGFTTGAAVAIAVGSLTGTAPSRAG